MKKKAFLALLVVVICMSVLVGCSSNGAEKVYSRNIASMDELKTSVGSDFAVPTVTLKGGDKFFDQKAFEGAVSIPEGAKNNEIILLYVPPISTNDVTALEGKADDKMYRYSIKHTIGAVVNPEYDASKSNNKDYNVPKYIYPYGEDSKLGRIELYLHGTNYNRVDQATFTKVTLVPIDGETGRKAKVEKDNKKDMDNIMSNEAYSAEDKALYWESSVKDGIYRYSNRVDGQVMRYYANTAKNTSYEATACIYLDNAAITKPLEGSGLKGKELDTAKAKAIEDAYKKLLAIATAELDAMMAGVIG